MVVETKLTAIEIANKMRKPRAKTASPRNLNSLDEEGFHDSELTFHGTPRKRKYPANRKKRDTIQYSTKRYDLNADYIKECQIKLLSFAPMYTQIYTSSWGHWHGNKYVYVDVIAITDNRMYKITKLVAKVMGLKMMRSTALTKMPNLISVPYSEKWDEGGKDDMKEMFVSIEEKLIKDLSTKMFGYDSGYFWNSQLKLFAYDVEKPRREKTYKAKVDKSTESAIIEDKPIVQKSYIVRKNT